MLFPSWTESTGRLNGDSSPAAAAKISWTLPYHHLVVFVVVVFFFYTRFTTGISVGIEWIANSCCCSRWHRETINVFAMRQLYDKEVEDGSTSPPTRSCFGRALTGMAREEEGLLFGWCGGSFSVLV